MLWSVVDRIVPTLRCTLTVETDLQQSIILLASVCLYGFSELVQRILKCSDIIPNIMIRDFKLTLYCS